LVFTILELAICPNISFIAMIYPRNRRGAASAPAAFGTENPFPTEFRCAMSRRLVARLDRLPLLSENIVHAVEPGI